VRRHLLYLQLFGSGSGADNGEDRTCRPFDESLTLHLVALLVKLFRKKSRRLQKAAAMRLMTGRW
jgi:hypothetical protein